MFTYHYASYPHSKIIDPFVFSLSVRRYVNFIFLEKSRLRSRMSHQISQQYYYYLGDQSRYKSTSKLFSRLIFSSHKVVGLYKEASEHHVHEQGQNHKQNSGWTRQIDIVVRIDREQSVSLFERPAVENTATIAFFG